MVGISHMDNKRSEPNLIGKLCHITKHMTTKDWERFRDATWMEEVDILTRMEAINAQGENMWRYLEGRIALKLLKTSGGREGMDDYSEEGVIRALAKGR